MSREKKCIMNRVFESQKHNDFFKEKGYSIINGFLNKEEIQSLKQLYLDNIPEVADGFHRSLDQMDKEYKKTMSDGVSNIVTPIAEEKLNDYRFLLVSYMIKEPGKDTIFEVHQNWNFVDESQFHSVAIWIPLQDVDESNGTMHVVEGSHRIFPTFRGGPEIPSIYRNIYGYIKKEYMKAIPLKAGDALIIDDALLHYSSPNIGKETRLAIAQVMIPKSSKAIYNYQPYGKVNVPIETYAIDDDFYLYFKNRYSPENPPRDCPLIERKLTSFPAITTNQFDALMKKTGTLDIKTEILPLEPEKLLEMSNSVKNEKENSTKSIYTPQNIVKEITHRLGLYNYFFEGKKIEGKEIEQHKHKPLYQEKPEEHSKRVGEFYNTQHDAFIQAYGSVIQAFRTKDVTILLDQQIQSIGFEEGQKVLDAGCGIAAPAIYFATQKNIEIDAITISEKQASVAKSNITQNGLSDKVKVTLGDYHLLNEHFPENHFDKVYFLESFGHSHDKKKLLNAVWDVLKPGGQIYIKDLFKKIAHHPDLQKSIDRELAKINEAYHYFVADLNVILDIAREKGFIIEFIKTIDFPLSDFEDLTISNEFQELTGIGKIENWSTYVFPIDFFEIRLMKPHFDLSLGTDRYFLQNIYRVQVENWDKNNL